MHLCRSGDSCRRPSLTMDYRVILLLFRYNYLHVVPQVSFTEMGYVEDETRLILSLGNLSLGLKDSRLQRPMCHNGCDKLNFDTFVTNQRCNASMCPEL
jgi:hypothetical protein